MYASTTVAPIKPDKWDDLASTISATVVLAYMARPNRVNKSARAVIYLYCAAAKVGL